MSANNERSVGSLPTGLNFPINCERNQINFVYVLRYIAEHKVSVIFVISCTFHITNGISMTLLYLYRDLLDLMVFNKSLASNAFLLYRKLVVSVGKNVFIM